ncbi:hypothetical protein ACSS6W_001769 [Trichoderma asperelloides]
MGSVRDNGYGLPAAMRRAAAVVADPHRADRRGKRRDKEVEVKGQRAGQSDRRCESGHRQAGLAARPRIWRAGALLVGNGDSAQRDASERQGDALRQWIGGSWMRDVDAGAGHEMVFGDRYHDELRLAGGSACTAAQAIHELLPKADTGKLMRWMLVAKANLPVAMF